MAPNRPGQPPHRDVAAVQQRLLRWLATDDVEHDTTATLDALGRDRSDDEQGLAALLDELGVRSPTELVGLVQLLTVSSAYTALSYARGLPLGDGSAVSADDVVRTSWVEAQWVVPEAPPTA